MRRGWKLSVRVVLLLLVGVVGLTPAFSQDDLAALKQQAIATYADIVFAGYEDAYTLALRLQAAVDAFVAEPSEEAFLAARETWRAAREPYGQTEAFRFYGGPIDDAGGPEALINAWPLDEAYVDYVEGAPNSGVINNPEKYPTIDADLLESLNESGSEENISVGYHAIEFLLWGQDLATDGAGARPYTDYTTAPNADRRGQYLTIAADLLVGHLAFLKDAWDPGIDDNYRAQFLAFAPDQALGDMLTGIGVLSKSELAGERMFTAYDNRDQEDEHSCFSDNTHRDLINNLRGISNVYLGEYTRIDGSVVSGTGLSAVMAATDADASQRTLDLLAQATDQIAAIHVPFDRAIAEEQYRPQVLDSVLTLFDLGDQIAENARLLGIRINTALPD
ncbi:MAG: imelysin family protein [Anaerolineae bacterium]